MTAPGTVDRISFPAGKASEALQQLLACPICAAKLSLSAKGARCADHGLFPQRDGLLSFVPDSLGEFDSHWKRAGGDQRPSAKTNVAKQFLIPVLDEASEAKSPLNVLDVGCGDGVHVQELVSANGAFRVAGLDYSAGALSSAVRVSGDWLPVHADAQHLPFADKSFDAVVSFGVQAYLPDPDRGLAELVRVTHPYGLIGVWYAPPRGGVAGALFSAARTIIPRLPAWAHVTMANALVPFLGLMPTASGLSLATGTWRECREVILVNIAPKHIVFPTGQHIEERFVQLGCEIVGRPDAIEGEYWARKGAA